MPTVQDRPLVVTILPMAGVELHPNTMGTRTASAPARRYVAGVALIVSLAFAEQAPSQSTSTDPATTAEAPTAEIDLDGVNARIKAVENAQDLDPATAEKSLELLRASAAQLELAREFTARTEVFIKSIEEGPQQLEELKKALESEELTRHVESDYLFPPEAPLSEIEPLLVKAHAQLSELRGERDAIQKALQRERDRPERARQRAREAARTVAETEKALFQTPPPDQSTGIGQAQRLLSRTRLKAAKAELNMLEQEMLSHDLRIRINMAKADLLNREIDAAESTAKRLERVVDTRRREDAERTQQAAIRARLEAVGKDPAIVKVAEHNAKLGAEFSTTVTAREQVRTEFSATNELRSSIEHKADIARQRLEIAGLNKAIGHILREESKSLPNVRGFRKRADRREQELVDIGLRQLRVGEQLKALDNIDAQAARLLSEEPLDEQAPPRSAETETELRTLLEQQHSLLEKLDAAYSTYARALSDLDFQQRQLIDVAQAYGEFIDQRLLWIPSHTPIDLDTLRDLGPAVVYLFSPHHWSAVLETLVGLFRDAPVTSGLGLLVFVLLIAAHGPLMRKLRRIGERVGQLHTDRFSLTIYALGITLLIAAAWPWLLGFFGRSLLDAEVSDFVHGVGLGMYTAALLLLVILSFSGLVCSGGVADRHFRWPQKTLNLLQTNLRWSVFVMIPSLVITVILSEVPEREHLASLGRFSYLVFSGSVAFLLHRVLSPNHGVPAHLMTVRPRSWLVRMRYLVYPFAVGTSLVLGGLAAVGYFYSSGALIAVFEYSLWVGVVAVIVGDLCLRWLRLTQRRLAWKKAKEERIAQLAARAEHDTHGGEGGPVVPEEPDMDLATIDEQTRRLINALLGISVVVALWLIWSNVFPALGFLNEVDLWSHKEVVDGKETLIPISLADVLLVVVLLVVVIAAARNLPGLLEIAILQRLPLDAGVRYAITTLCQYSIVTIGVLVMFATLGIGWSNVQWLVAAVSVGLGFGLQEIFANFVSGIIILFERPVRIGDTVTVGQITGTVTRIRIRATTIMDWDNKEIVVPNKTFITSQLTNWTLTDPIVRAVLRVRVAHNSDTELAHRIMLETAQNMPLVLDHPEPTVYFLGLGESSLDFDVRIFVKDLWDWLPAMHEYNMKIEKALREAGVQIPYPQRDIHVRSVTDMAGRPLYPAGEEGSVKPLFESKKGAQS